MKNFAWLCLDGCGPEVAVLLVYIAAPFLLLAGMLLAIFWSIKKSRSKNPSVARRGRRSLAVTIFLALILMVLIAASSFVL